MEQTIITLLAASLGFIAKSLWDQYWKRRDSANAISKQKRLELLERQLTNFYWPIYLHLQKNNVVYNQLIYGRSFENSIRKSVNKQLYHTFFKDNHKVIIKLIENNIHLAQPDARFEAVLLQYIRHVTIFMALRDLGHENIDPIDIGVPWPSDFFDEIEKRLKDTQACYEREIGWTKIVA